MARLSVCGRFRTQPQACRVGYWGPGPPWPSGPLRRVGSTLARNQRYKWYGSTYTRLAVVKSIDGCRRMPDRCHGGCLGCGSAPGLPSPMVSVLTDTPSPRVRSLVRIRSVDPRPRVQCPASIQSDGSRTVERMGSIGYHQPAPLRARLATWQADCPDFARAACIHLHANQGAGGRSQRGGPVAVREVGIREVGP